MSFRKAELLLSLRVCVQTELQYSFTYPPDVEGAARIQNTFFSLLVLCTSAAEVCVFCPV